MVYRNGDPYRGNWLRDEVLYLHSLWNQGPHLSSSGNPNPNPNPNPIFTHLRPRSSVKLSKHRKHHSRRKKAVTSEKEWPCNPDPDPNHAAATGWPEPPPKPAQRPPSAEDLAAALASRAQKNGVELCTRFFSRKGFDGDFEEGDSAAELEEEDAEEVEKRAFKFFVEVFTEDNELRGYYEKNHEKGEFLCLVCEGSGAKKGRKYGDCVGLVQHCSNVARKGPRAAHRGLARALCRVVGWNFDRLPMFVLDLEETLGQELARDSSRQQCHKDRKRLCQRKKAVTSEKEWPCYPTSDLNHAVATGWPEPPPKLSRSPPSAEDLAMALATRAQNNGVEVCRRFFSKKDTDGDSEEGDSSGELVEYDIEEEQEVEDRAFKFFMEVFTEDNELRRFYEANHEKGGFLCLVCEGSGAKKGRMYGDCVGLVQHCSNVAKIGQRAAHRGLAKALCRVVGWNFDKLPMFILDLEETLGQTLARDAS